MEPYHGGMNDGLTGFLSGLGWGLVGTISKPAIGVLDLATGAATAVKESSKSKFKQLPPRMRPPRLVLGAGGSMPAYSTKSALGQELLHKMNGRNYQEIFVAHEQLRSGHEDLQILISNQRVLVFSQALSKDSSSHNNGQTSDGGVVTDRVRSTSKAVLSVFHNDIICARVVTEKEDDHTKTAPDIKIDLKHEGSKKEIEKHYIELVIHSGVVSTNRNAEDQQKRPQVRCDSEQMARIVVQHINYARNMHEEMTQAVIEEAESGAD